MKKILSCVLAIALVLSLMSMTVCAAEVWNDNNPVKTGDNYAAVGTQGKRITDDAESLKDGVAEIEDITNGNANITVNYQYTNSEGQTEEIFKHRYAVDIVYANLIIDLTSLVTEEDGKTISYSYVWDVNKHTYVKVDNNGNVVEDTDNGDDTTKITIAGAFQLINHSDMPIFYTASVASDSTYGTKLNLGIDAAGTVTVTNKEVSKATIGAYNAEDRTWVDGEAKEGDQHSIIATPVNSWIDTINNLINVNVGNNPVGHLTITISAEATAAPTT